MLIGATDKGLHRVILGRCWTAGCWIFALAVGGSIVSPRPSGKITGMHDYGQPWESGEFVYLDLFHRPGDSRPRILFPLTFSELLDQAGLEYNTMEDETPAAGPSIPFALEILVESSVLLAEIVHVLIKYSRWRQRRIFLRRESGKEAIELSTDQSDEEIEDQLRTAGVDPIDPLHDADQD
jgi:hypothetical protein